MILITEDVWGLDFENLGKRYPIIYKPDLWKDPEKILEEVRDAQALVVRNRTKVDAKIIESGKNLRVIARAGVGLDNIDIQTADSLGIAVSAALGVNSISVGEHVVGLALSLLRNTLVLDSQLRQGQWNRVSGVELRGKTWGFLGFGATARATAKLLKGFDLSFLAYDPYVRLPESEHIEWEKMLTNFDRVISQSDVISIHLPRTPQTQNLVNADVIARMKPGVYLINVGRGEILNETDLIASLKSGFIAGAALDVRAQEPPQLGELEKFSNVILTPHIAGVTKESQSAIIKILAQDIERALTGQELLATVGTIKRYSV